VQPPLAPHRDHDLQLGGEHRIAALRFVRLRIVNGTAPKVSAIHSTATIALYNPRLALHERCIGATDEWYTPPRAI
jgi:hypothetical protein